MTDRKDAIRPHPPAPHCGLICPKCGECAWRVWSVRHYRRGIIRVRKCKVKGCGKAIRTREIIECTAVISMPQKATMSTRGHSKSITNPTAT